ncbi:thiosulfate transmembrane transporter [Aureococcus anophagefferens]|nr:thiosulfate transmembrane transporter [Aureococcus anophagefferens]
MAAAAPRKPTSTDDVPLNVKFATAGLGGIMGWMCVHPFNTAAVRMNLASTQPNYQPTGFIFYATSRFGLFETFRDAIAARREIGVAERLAAGLASARARR